MMILDRILDDNRKLVAERKKAIPLETMKREACAQSETLDFTTAVSRKGIGIIAEVKKASPSRGLICTEFDPTAIALTYAENGASAISVLTEPAHFQGDTSYLLQIRNTLERHSLPVPLLRKDFIFDEYQVYEARAFGADAILLIVAALTPEQLACLLRVCRNLGMAALVEIHTAEELKTAIDCNARIIGINNRDLHTFTVDLAVTETLAPLVPSDRLIISESGFKTGLDIDRIQKCGVNAVLIGEALSGSSDIAEKMKEFV